VTSSNRVGVLEIVLVEAIAAGKYVLIATDFPYFQNCIDEWLTRREIRFGHLCHSLSDRQVFTYCNQTIVLTPEIGQYHVIVVVNGVWSEWQPLFDGDRGILEVVYRLECSPFSPAASSGNVCRSAAWYCMASKSSPKPSTNLADAIVINRRNSNPRDRPSLSRFAETDVSDADFWPRFFSSQRSRPTVGVPGPGDGIPSWTPLHRIQFVRGLFSFGFAREEHVMEMTGLTLSVSIFQGLSRGLLRLLINFAHGKAQIASDIATILIQSEDTSLESLVDQGVFGEDIFRNYLRRKSCVLLNRIRVMHFIGSFIKQDTLKISQLHIAGELPAEWWTFSNDEALCRGVWKYGLTNYEFFACDDDPDVRNITQVRFDRLNERINAISEAVMLYFLEGNVRFAVASEFGAEETGRLIQRLDEFGIDVDSHGNFDFAAFKKNAGLSISVPDTRRFVETIRSGGLDANSLLRLTQRIDGMLKLQLLFLEEESPPRVFERAPKWELMGANWVPSLECTFFSELRRLGFARIPEIYSAPEFDGQLDISTIYVIQRISVLYTFAQHRQYMSETQVEYPITIASSNMIHCIGKIEFKRPGFHTERYIYPIGFRSSRVSASADDPDEKVTWISEIADVGEEAPVFRVWMAHKPELVFEGQSPTAPWSSALKAVSKARGEYGRGISISGPEAFLLASPIAVFLIQDLPGADKCTKYIRREFTENPLTQRPRPPTEKRDMAPEARTLRFDDLAYEPEDPMPDRTRPKKLKKP
jgi:hypothetical protein